MRRIDLTGSAPRREARLGPSTGALIPRGIWVALLAAMVLAGMAFWSTAAYAEEAAEPVWSADMTVVEYTSVSIGAASADLFSNVGGSGNLQIKSLWSHIPDRDLRLAFADEVPNAADYTLQVGDLSLEFPEDSSGSSSFKWHDVDVDWEDGQIIRVRIVLTTESDAPQTNTPNNPATGAPTISGTPQVGETLTADTSAIGDEDGLDDVEFSYQWLADDTDIEGATDSTYTLTASEQGKTVKVKVSFTDDAENEESLTSVATVAVAAKPNTAPTGLPTISGTPQVGETLTADTSAIEDEDGLTSVSYSYQWIAADTDIDGATSSTYTLVDADQGKTVKVKVSFTDDAENEESLTSAATVAVAAKPNTAPTGLPTISGTPQVGETLTADTSAIEDEDGLTSVSYSYQWLTDDTDIEGATDSTYTLTASEQGKTVKVKVTFTDDAENEESLTSAATVAVAAKPNTAPTGLPTISGTPQVGETLTANTSAIEDEDGLDDVEFSYQWIAADTDIEGATDSTYTLVDADQGKTVKVKVTFTDDAENEESLTSVATVAVAAKPNTAPTGLPTISGTPQVGETLTADISAIGDEDGLTSVSYSYQWIAAATDIEGATDSTYTLVEADQGKTVKVKVTFTDDAENEESLTSAVTDAVAAKPNTAPTGLPTISGTAQVGETLTADTSAIEDEDGLDDVEFSYQWLAGDTDIEGATDSTYTLVEADQGKTVKVKVTFTDDAENEETLTSVATVAVAAKPNTAPTGLPTISGTPQVEETLTANTSAIEDEDGLDDVEFSYQWIAGDTDIDGATSSTYTLVEADQGKTVKVKVSFTDDAENEESLTSAATVAILPQADDTEPAAPIWSADMLVVEHTSVSIGAASADLFSNVGGSGNLQIKSLWSYVPDRDLRLAFTDEVPSAADYTLQVGDLSLEFPAGSSGASSFKWYDVDVDWEDGQLIRVRIVLTSEIDTQQTNTPNIPATGVPAIIGTAQVGETLTADTSAIGDEDGLDDVEFSYQWIRTDAHIAGATDSTYTLTGDDQGKTIKLKVSFIDDKGNSETLISAATTEVNKRPHLVSNLGVNVAVGIMRPLNAARSGFAQAFTTGAKTGGYALGSVGIQVSEFSDGSTAGDHLRVTINSVASGGGPGDAHCTLANPSSFPTPGVIAFEAPTGAGSCPQFTAETTYFVVIEWLNPSGTDAFALIPQTFPTDEAAATEEDPGGAEGWSIADQAYYLSVSSDARTWTEYDETASFKIKVKDGAVTAAKANSPATGLLTITGTPQVGQTLTADTSAIEDADGLEDVSYEYQWIAGGTDIDGATSSSYEITSSEQGQTIQVRVTFTDAADNEETLTSAATEAVATAPNHPATGAPTITGTPQVDHTLTAGISPIADEDGLDNVSYSYQWMSGGSDIDGATGSTYTLTASEQGKTVQVRVTFTDDADNEESLTSAATVVVQPGGNAWSATMTVETRDGFTGYSYWGDPDLGSLSETEVEWEGKTHYVRYIFLKDGELRLGLNEEMFSTGFVLTVGDEEFGSAETMVDKGGGSYRFRWDDPGLGWSDGDEVSVNLVQSAQNTPALGAPTISGTAQVGETLSVDTSDIKDADGLDNVSYTYKWIANDRTNDTDIGNATDATYTLTDDYTSNTIKVRVTFTDDRDNEETLTSEATDAVAARPNSAPAGLPTISGTPQVGETLTAETSAISDADGLTNVSFSYQWVAGGTDIDGATGSSYTLTSSEQGQTITVQVTFTDDADNTETLTSEATDAVAATVPTAPQSLTVSTGDQVQELEASWQAPSSNGGSAVTGYKVQWKEAADSWDTAADVSEATATGTTHTITDLTGGVEYAVRVMATNDVGDGPASTEAKGTPAGGVSEQVVEPENNAPTGLPTISGTPQVDETMTADTSEIDDADGLTNVSYGYQWIAGESDIDGATGSSFTLTASEQGQTIQVRVTFTDDADNEETLTSEETQAVEAATTPEVVTTDSPLTGFTLVDTSGQPQTVLASPTDGGTLSLDDPANGSYGIQVNTMSGAQIGSVRLQLSGAKSVDRTENWAPYTLYGDQGDRELNGESLSVGSYTLTATAYSEGRLGGEEIGILTVSFTVVAATTNIPARGLPTINGVPQVEQRLTADTSAITDTNGLTNVSYNYQWMADGSDINGATDSSYTLTSSEQGKTIQVRVSFTDDADNAESLTSAATVAVVAAPTPEVVVTPVALTASFSNVPSSHDGSSEFTFNLSFSENVAPGYARIRDDAFTISDGVDINQAQRVTQGSNQHWTIQVKPGGTGDVSITLPATTNCNATGAICTTGGKKLSNSLSITVSGPGE